MGAVRAVGRHFQASFIHGLRFERAAAFDTSFMLTQAGLLAMQALIATAPLMGMLVLAALVAPLMLGGWLFSTQALGPKFDKLDPIAGIKRLISTQSLAELFKALAKSLLIGGVAWLVIMDGMDEVNALMAQSERAALPQMILLVARNCALITAALLLIALVDVPGSCGATTASCACRARTCARSTRKARATRTSRRRSAASSSRWPSAA